jgi:SNF2 family DNA or RNA helicase
VFLLTSSQDYFVFSPITGAASEIESDILHKLHKILRPFLLRRLKSDVATDLPPKKETLLYVGLTDLQKQIYRQILSKDIDALNGIALFWFSNCSHSLARSLFASDLLNLFETFRLVQGARSPAEHCDAAA